MPIRKTLFLLALAAIWGSPVDGKTWHIHPAGTGDAPSINAGIDSAAAGDTVSLADGEYTGFQNLYIDLQGKAIVLRSGSGDPEACYVSLAGSPVSNPRGLIIESGETAATVIEGIGFVDGDISYGGPAARIKNISPPTIVRCRFSRNSAGADGGAVLIRDSQPYFIECVFDSNESDQGGGAVHFAGVGFPHFYDCSFIGNTAGINGGALDLSEPVAYGIVVSGCLFEGNSAVQGGGIFTGGYEAIRVEDCVFRDNTALDKGGGMIGQNGNLEVEGCTGSVACRASSARTATSLPIRFSATPRQATSRWMPLLRASMRESADRSAYSGRAAMWRPRF